MPEDVMLQEAIRALRNGERSRSRDLLTRLLRTDAQNPEYWLWMSAAVQTVQERIYCLQRVERLDPLHPGARLGLRLAGALPKAAAPPAGPPLRRRWTVPEISETRPRHSLSLTARVLLILCMGLFLIGALTWYSFSRSASRRAVAQRPTHTAGPPPTYTATPTYIGGQPSPESTPLPENTPRQASTQPPSAGKPASPVVALEATFTATPLSVNTPHPISEAYRLGLNAFSGSDWEAAAGYFGQAGRDEPSADLFYHLGESYRMQADYEQARRAFLQSLELDPNFAPAHLGLARTARALDPKADILPELNRALQSDPEFGEAYLERAAIHLERNALEEARADIDEAARLFPDSPLVSYYQARLALLNDHPAAALKAAQKAREQDPTLLPVYQVLGQAALLRADWDTAVEALQIYLASRPEDSAMWAALGRALSSGTAPDYPGAASAYSQALALDEEYFEALYGRGQAYLALGEGQAAVNDLVAARRAAGTSLNRPENITLRFELELNLGRALLAAGRAPEARKVLKTIHPNTGDQRAALTYWQARAAEADGDPADASAFWRALLELPAGDVPVHRRDYAARRLSALATPTPEPTATHTRTPAPTRTATRTPAFTPTSPATRTPRATHTPAP